MKTRKWNRLFAAVAVLILITGCNPFTIVTRPAVPPTPVVEYLPGPTETPSAAPEPAATQPPAQPGKTAFAVYEPQEMVFRGYDAQGNQTFTMAAPGIQWLNPRAVQVFDRDVYYITDIEKTIFHATETSAVFVDLPVDRHITSIVVSPDQKMIAWGSFYGDEAQPRSTIMLANLDGSNARVVATYTVPSDANPLTALNLMPIAFTEDGNLLYEQGVTGIGGYILYGRYSNLYSLDLQTGETSVIVPDSDHPGTSLEAFRLDLNRAAFNTNEQVPAITIRNLADNTQQSLANPEGTGIVGSVAWSPSGGWIAYAASRGNPDDEAGMVMLVPGDLSANPVAVARVENKSYPYVHGWLDENTIIFSRHATDAGSTVWAVQRDGSGLTQLAAGQFAGMAK